MVLLNTLEHGFNTEMRVRKLAYISVLNGRDSSGFQDRNETLFKEEHRI